MIVDAILDAFQSAIEWIAGLFPDGGDLGLVSYLSTVLGNLGALNYYLPIAETFAVVVGVLLVFPLLMGVSLTVWIFSQIRGSAAK